MAKIDFSDIPKAREPGVATIDFSDIPITEVSDVNIPTTPTGKEFGPPTEYYREEEANRLVGELLNREIEKSLAERAKEEDTGFWEEAGKALRKSGAMVYSAALGTTASIAMAGGRAPEFQLYKSLAPTPKQSRKFWREQQRPIIEYMNKPELLANPTNVRGYIGSVLGTAIPYMGTAIMMGTIGGPIAAAMVGFSVEGEEAYQNAIRGKATEREAQKERLIVGTINAAIEGLSISHIMKFAKAGRHSLPAFKALIANKVRKGVKQKGLKLLAELSKLGIKEGLEEFAQGGVSISVPAILRGDYPVDVEGNPDWWEIGGRLGEEYLAGHISGTFLAGGGRVATGTLGRVIKSKSDAIVDEYKPRMREAIRRGDKEAATAIWHQMQAEMAGETGPIGEKFEPEEVTEPAITEEEITPPEITREDKIHKAQQIARQERAIEAREEALVEGEEGRALREKIGIEEPTKPIAEVPKTETQEAAEAVDEDFDEAKFEAELERAIAEGRGQDVPATDKQKTDFHTLTRELGLTTEKQFKDYLEGITGKRSTTQLTKRQLTRAIRKAKVSVRQMNAAESMLTPAEITDVKKAAKQSKFPDAYQRTLSLMSSKIISIPKDNPQLRRSILNDVKVSARSAKHMSKKQLREDHRYQRRVSLLNPLSSARYAIGYFEHAAGKSLRPLYSDMVAKSVGSRLLGFQMVEQVYADAGLNPDRVHISFADNNAMRDFLYHEDETVRREAYDKIKNPDVQKLAEGFQKLLAPDSPTANMVRKLRFIMWDKKGWEPPDIAKMESEVKKSILEEGRRAQETGRLEEWIGTQSWGTREFYYMAQTQGDNIADHLVSSLMPPEWFGYASERATSVPRHIPSELRARKGKGRPKPGPVPTNIINHITRIHMANAISEDLEVFWKRFNEANPSQRDIDTMRGFIDSITGRPHLRGTPARITESAVRNIRRFFWRIHFVNPARSTWFAYRNLHQNSFLASQASVRELSKAGLEIVGEKLTGAENEQRFRHYKEDHDTRITQKAQQWRQAIMLEEASAATATHNRAWALMDAMGRFAVYSDEINRNMAWPLFHRVAQRNAQLYEQGKINFNKLSSRLKLDTLMDGDRMQLKNLIVQKDFDTFIRKYAEYKTENTHFRYETALRAAVEQDALSRSLWGLMVYPRGVAEIMYQNGAKPLTQGIQNKDWRQAYQGLSTITMFMVGSAGAEELIRRIWGKTAYGISKLGIPEVLLRYSILGPGLGKVYDMMQKINEMEYTAAKENWTWQQFGNRIGIIAGDLIEWMAPLMEQKVNYYESQNDVYGVGLWSQLKENWFKPEYKKRRGTPFKKTDRTYWQKIAHTIWGGFERPEEEEGREKYPKAYE